MNAPPESFFALINAGGRKVQDPDINPHRRFYKKYIDMQGMPVVASREVDDRALQRTYEIVTHMPAGRPDILKAIIAEGARLVVLGRNERIREPSPR